MADGEPAKSLSAARLGCKMAKKKDRAFFVCPRWDEVATAPHRADNALVSGSSPGSAKNLLAIRNGQPVARSTLRKALQAVRQASGVMFDVDAYIVDQRTLPPR